MAVRGWRQSASEVRPSSGPVAVCDRVTRSGSGATGKPILVRGNGSSHHPVCDEGSRATDNDPGQDRGACHGDRTGDASGSRGNGIH